MDKSISANRRQIIRQKLKKQTYEVVESCGWEPFLSIIFLSENMNSPVFAGGVGLSQ